MSGHGPYETAKACTAQKRPAFSQIRMIPGTQYEQGNRQGAGNRHCGSICYGKQIGHLNSLLDFTLPFIHNGFHPFCHLFYATLGFAVSS
jgi:hypothetical protein